MVRKKVTRKVSRRVETAARSEVAPQGRRFDDAQRQRALVLVASGMSRVQVAATIGTTTESLRRWVKDAAAAGTTPPVPIAKTAPARAAAGSRPSTLASVQWLAAAGHTDLETTQGYVDQGMLIRGSFGQPHPPLPSKLLTDAADPELWRNYQKSDANSLKLLRPQRELNPCYRRERPVS
jgi:hypothetical protein